MTLLQYATDILKVNLTHTQRWTLEALEHNPEGLLRVLKPSGSMKTVLDIHKKWRNMQKVG